MTGLTKGISILSAGSSSLSKAGAGGGKKVSTLTFEPGEAGEYDVYLVGNKFTGRVAFSTYKCE